MSEEYQMQIKEEIVQIEGVIEVLIPSSNSIMGKDMIQIKQIVKETAKLKYPIINEWKSFRLEILSSKQILIDKDDKWNRCCFEVSIKKSY